MMSAADHGAVDGGHGLGGRQMQLLARLADTCDPGTSSTAAWGLGDLVVVADPPINDTRSSSGSHPSSRSAAAESPTMT